LFPWIAFTCQFDSLDGAECGIQAMTVLAEVLDDARVIPGPIAAAR